MPTDPGELDDEMRALFGQARLDPDQALVLRHASCRVPKLSTLGMSIVSLQAVHSFLAAPNIPN